MGPFTLAWRAPQASIMAAARDIEHPAHEQDVELLHMRTDEGEPHVVLGLVPGPWRAPKETSSTATIAPYPYAVLQPAKQRPLRPLFAQRRHKSHIACRENCLVGQLVPFCVPSKPGHHGEDEETKHAGGQHEDQVGIAQPGEDV